MAEHWIVACVAAALLMRAGLAVYLAGMVRAKNAGGTLLRLAADLFLMTLAFWAVGLAFFNPAGTPHALLDWHMLFGGGTQSAAVATVSLRLLAPMLIGTGIVVGAVCERSRFFPSLAASALLGGVVMPVLARCAWNGWLLQRGFHDLAGAAVVHVAGAVCATVGVIAVGPRQGKYNHDGSSNVLPGHSVPLVCIGAFIMLAAWFPYVLSFAAPGPGPVAMNVLLAAAAGGLTAMCLCQWRFGKPEIYLTLCGMLGGLVAITAAADTLSSPLAVLTGAVAGYLVPTLSLHLDLVLKVDDPSGLIAVHGFGGAWGIFAAALFSPMPRVADHFKAITVQALGLMVVMLVTAVASVVLFVLVRRISRLRSREADEFDGLDLAEHDIGSYPDFQQNMIKSYHLREA